MLLKYCLNGQTELPELSDPDNLLQTHERKAWIDELSRLVKLQELSDGLEIEFPRVRDLPTRFRVRKEQGASNRVHDYILEPIEPLIAMIRPRHLPGAAITSPITHNNGAGQTPAWPQHLLAEVQAIVEGLQADKESRPGLLYLLEDLGELVNQGPRELALQLLLAFAVVRYLRSAAVPDQHRRALTYYEISLDALESCLLQMLQTTPPTITNRLMGFLDFLWPARDAPRGGK